ncbi:MAG: 2Fe-2S iron-sulfur cluster-binding protein [Pseudobdellovibrionaceae bacterium]|jgi:ferredoxin
MEKCEIAFVLHGQEKTVTYDPGESILDCGIRNDLNPPYSCMEGVCSACLATVVEGKVDFPDDTILDEEEFKNGKVLTCQAKPAKGCSRLKIRFD